MNKQVALLIACLCLSTITSGCASLQVERDLQHSKSAEQYRNSLKGDFPPLSQADCSNGIMGSAWSGITFSQTSRIVKLPDGTAAAAACFKRPPNSQLLQLMTYATGGMTYFELTVVHPSVLLLNGEFQPVKNLAKPKLSPGEHFFKGLRLTGNIPLNGELSSTEYVVMYVHPMSLDGAIDVHTGYQTIPVPYSPYGKVELRYQ